LVDDVLVVRSANDTVETAPTCINAFMVGNRGLRKGMKTAVVAVTFPPTGRGRAWRSYPALLDQVSMTRAARIRPNGFRPGEVKPTSQC
jgi:hypothetical protein